MYKILQLSLGIFLFTSVTAQVNTHVEPGEHLTCNHNKHYVEYCQKNGIDPYNNKTFNDYERQMQAEAAMLLSKTGERAGPPYVIPVVFHVVHTGGVENISDAQIKDAVSILNRDFNKLNADTSMVVPAFAGIIANCEVEFRLAQRDALGNCVSGITRTFSSTTNDGDQNMVDKVNLNLNGGTSTDNLKYPRSMYLNIWVCKNASGAAGYTNTPVGALFSASKYDGIWIGYNYVGSIEAGSPLTSRALTHEIGHWLNLSHVWGNTNNPGVACGDDSVGDTPETEGWSSCNTSGATCGNVIDNVQNYMEYSYCSRMFTEGQKARMYATLNSGICSRNNLHTATNLTATGVDGAPNLCAADFDAPKTLICAGDSISFSDISYHGATGWNWNFASGSPAVSTVQYPVITYNTPGQYNVDLTVTDGFSNATITKNNYVTVLDPVGAALPFSEGFESVSSLPSADWYLTNSDGQQAWEIEPSFGFSGTRCMKLNNFDFNNTGAKDVFISKTFDASGVTNVGIHFKYAYRQRIAGDNEKLKVYVSNSCGNTWSLRKQIVGSTLSGSMSSTTAYTPAPGEWMDFVVNVSTSTFLVQGFMFKIEFESDQGNNIYIDDINLGQNVGLDEENPASIGFSVYPNPVTNTATISYSLPSSQEIAISVSDMLGQPVVLLDKGKKAAGNHVLDLNANQLKAKGIYFVTIQSGQAVYTQKIVLQ